MTKKHKIFFSLLSIVLIVSLIIFFTIKKFYNELPPIEEIEQFKPNLTTKIFDINENLIDEFYIEKRTFVPLKQIPKNLIHALISTEDRKFYKHWGIDLFGLVRAVLNSMKDLKGPSATSTLTQQLARNLFLTLNRSYKRKIQEALLAIQIEHNYSKDEILQMYLNQIYFGHGVYGIYRAAQLYFNKLPQDLTIQECAMLAALPKAPTYYSPYKNPEAALRRRNLVIKNMEKENFITKEEAKQAINSPLGVYGRPETRREASYFVEYIRQQLEPKYGQLLYKGGLKIYTTLDINMQSAAVKAIDLHLTEFDIQKSSMTTTDTNTDMNNIEQKPPVQASIIALDPQTGQIRALVGGRDFTVSQFNRAVQAKRQPGSSFKPFIFAAALDQGWKATDMLDDARAVYYNNGKDWQLIGQEPDLSDVDPELKQNIDLKDPDIKNILWMPQNYSKKYRGKVTLRKALAHSINLCSINLLKNIGPATAANYAKRLGITSKVDPYLSMALGSFVVTPLEITNAYATLANAGIKTKPYAIIKVCDSNGQTLEENFPEQQEVLSAQTAFLITYLLEGVVKNGTGWRAKALGREVAAKTGTTNDCTDAWFIGYTPQLVTSVWVGYDDCTSLGKNETGSKVAAPIWVDFMQKALEDKPRLKFTIPQNIVFLPINKDTGLRALKIGKNSYMEAFLKGNEPKKFSIFSSLFNKNNNVEELTPEQEETIENNDEENIDYEAEDPSNEDTQSQTLVGPMPNPNMQ